MDIIILNEEQRIAADKLIEFLNNSNEEIFTLEGVAGTGKTTLLKEVIKEKNNVIAACISHVAKTVLMQSIGDYAECFTIAQLLKMKQHIDEEGKVSFLPSFSANNPYVYMPIQDADILIIDECSMIDDEIHSLIMRYKNKDCKLIYVGDPFQLKPINTKIEDSDSITFSYTKSKLTKAVRYGGIIADFGDRIREEISKINSGKTASKYLINEWMSERNLSKRTSFLNEDGSGIIFLNNIEDVINISCKEFESEDVFNMRLIGYRRKSTKQLNEAIREQIYINRNNSETHNLPQFLPDELVICDGGYQKFLFNNQSFIVESFIKVIGPEEIPCLAIKMKNCDFGNKVIYVVDQQEGIDLYNTKLESLKFLANNDKRQWKNVLEFKEKFCNLEYSYSINAHRS